MHKGILGLMALGLSATLLTGCSAGQAANPTPPTPGATQESSVDASAEPSESASEEATDSASPETSESESPETESESPEASESSAPQVSGKTRLSDNEFTDIIREKTTTAYIMGNNEIVEIAKETCDAYEEGGNLRTVLGNISEKFLDTTANVKMDEKAFFGDLAYIAGAGVGNYCPEYSDQFKSDIDTAVAEAKKKS